MSLLDKHLSLTKANNGLLDIYRDSISSEAIFGCIHMICEDFIGMTKYNDYGEYDGICIIRKDDISRLRWAGKERESLAKLVEKKNIHTKLPQINTDSLSNIIESIQKSYSMATIYTEEIDTDVCFIGEIIEMDEDYLVMHEYGTMRSLDRPKVLLEIEEVTRIEADGKYERNLVSLHSGKNKNPVLTDFLTDDQC